MGMIGAPFPLLSENPLFLLTTRFPLYIVSTFSTFIQRCISHARLHRDAKGCLRASATWIFAWTFSTVYTLIILCANFAALRCLAGIYLSSRIFLLFLRWLCASKEAMSSVISLRDWRHVICINNKQINRNKWERGSVAGYIISRARILGLVKIWYVRSVHFSWFLSSAVRKACCNIHICSHLPWLFQYFVLSVFFPAFFFQWKCKEQALFSVRNLFL